MTDPIADRELIERARLEAKRESEVSRMMAQSKSLRQAGHEPPRDDLYMWSKPEETNTWKLADALQSRIAEVGRLTERVRELEAAEATRDDLGKRALEYHQETTCPCVAAERYVESCPKHGYVDGAALSLQRRV